MLDVVVSPKAEQHKGTVAFMEDEEYSGKERRHPDMDIRTEIINNVLQALADQKQEIREKVEAVLHIQLQEYEVQKRTTEVMVHDGSSLGMVRRFIATKRLEGKSEKTLRKYQPELEKLVRF